jgi:SPP1 family phage portal protein
MELEQLLEQITDFAKIKDQLETGLPEYSELKEQYEPKLHAIKNKSDKTIKVEEYNDKGEPTGNMITKIVDVAKIPISLQKKIVSIASTMLCGNPIQYAATTDEGSDEDKLFQAIKKTWDDNKLDFHTKRLLRYRMSECQCAELWYKEEADDTYWAGTGMEGSQLKMRAKILAPSLGDSLYPIYNSVGDMIAFIRGIILGDEDKTEQWEVYTADKIFIIQKKSSGYTVIEDKPNELKKIPIIYYEQPAPEWDDVQTLIERLEDVISTHADTNDYTGSPIILVSGEVKGFSAKGEAGKVLEMSDGADAKYLESSTAPQSIELEMKNLRSLIYDLTSTPDISFDQVKGLGAYSGIALRMIFLAAHMKASEHEETFGEGIQRRLNFIKACMITINPKLEKANTIVVKPRFEYFVPINVQEEIQNLNTAVTGGLISKQTAIGLNPLVTDPESEMKVMAEESGAAAQQPAMPSKEQQDPKNTKKPTTKTDPNANPNADPSQVPNENDTTEQQENTGVVAEEDLSRIALTINYLSLTMERAKAAGDTDLANKLSSKIDELLLKM